MDASVQVGPLEMEVFSVGRRHEGTLLNRPYGTKNSGGGDIVSPGTEVPRYFHSVPTGQDTRGPLEEETSPLTRISFTSWPDGSRAAGSDGGSQGSNTSKRHRRSVDFPGFS